MRIAIHCKRQNLLKHLFYWPRTFVSLLILGVQSALAQPFSGILAENQVRLFARINQYDPERYNYLSASQGTELSSDKANLTFQKSQWQIDKSVKLLKARQYEVSVSFRCLAGEVPDGSVSLDLRFDNWSKANYVLLPAAAYNGNRYDAVQMDYSPFYVSKSQMGLSKPILLSDQPRLNVGNGYSRIQDRSGSMTMPAVGVHAPATKQGFLVCFQQGNRLGDYGVDVEELKGNAKATVTITSPVVREIRKYTIARMDKTPSDDQPVTFRAGESVNISFVVCVFPSPNVQSLFDKLLEVRSMMYPFTAGRQIIPFSAVYPIIETHKNAENWREAGYYANSPDNGWGSDWQPSWVGGLPGMYALFAHGSALTKDRVITNCNWLYPKGMSPSGLYYDLGYKGRFTSAKEDKPFGANLALTRKNASATYYAMKLFGLMKDQNVTVPALWEEKNLQALETLLRVWDKHQQLGQYVNQQTGELEVGGTTSAGIFPAALCLAYTETGNKRYLKAAEEIADYFYTNFVCKGLTYGGPSDAMQSFESESCYALLESFVELYETTRDTKWLTYSKEIATQFASWVVAYDYQFPPNSVMGKLNMQTTGTVYANTQNKHTSAGICTHSGLALLKLYRATQQPVYLNLLQSIAHAIPQYMSFADRPIPGYKNGWISERINMTDWQQSPPIGGVMVASNWNEIAMLLTRTELPGIYVNLESKQVFAMDHVEASLTADNQLLLTNPTRYDAEVTVLAETKAQAKQPLGQRAFRSWRIVKAPAHQTVRVVL